MNEAKKFLTQRLVAPVIEFHVRMLPRKRRLILLDGAAEAILRP